MPGARRRDLDGENHPPKKVQGNNPYHCQGGERPHTQKARREYQMISTEILSTPVEESSCRKLKKISRSQHKLWAGSCYIHHLNALHTPKSQSAGSSSNEFRIRSPCPRSLQNPHILQTDRWTGGGRTRGTCGYPQLAHCFLFSFSFFFLIKINISNPHWPPA